MIAENALQTNVNQNLMMINTRYQTDWSLQGIRWESFLDHWFRGSFITNSASLVNLQFTNNNHNNRTLWKSYVLWTTRLWLDYCDCEWRKHIRFSETERNFHVVVVFTFETKANTVQWFHIDIKGIENITKKWNDKSTLWPV